MNAIFKTYKNRKREVCYCGNQSVVQIQKINVITRFVPVLGELRGRLMIFKDDGNSFTKEAGAPLSFATLSFAPLPFAQNQRKVAEGSENAPKG